MSEIKVAQVTGLDATAYKIAWYLPANYEVTSAWLTDDGKHVCVIQGTDNAGWTLEDYVIPRLGSGMYRCEYLGTRA
jgi:hypothetical protein